jgi:hypothetical protein
LAVTSQIDPTKPTEGQAFTADVRKNFQTAHDEIGSLQTGGSSNAGLIAAETQRAQQAETTIAANLTTETQRAQQAETTIAANLTTETQRAQQAETTIAANLTTETQRAQASEVAIDSLSAILLFGTGSDGDITISSGTTTLTRDMHYRNLTINGTGSINNGGFRIYVSGTLDLTAAPAGAITNNSPNGNAASGSVGGVTPTAYLGLSLPRLLQSAATGGTGNLTTGSNGVLTPPNVPFAATLGLAGVGGAGGTGTSAGASGVAAQPINVANVVFNSPIPVFVQLYGGATALTSFVVPSLVGGGGGQGGGDGTVSGGGGGSPSYGGGMVAIWARNINRGAGTAVGAIQAKSGNGGNGGTPAVGNAGGGGGGGAGTGGTVFICCQALLGASAANAIDVSGGTGGTGGNGFGTARGGQGGRGGGSGSAFKIILNGPTYIGTTPATNGGLASAASTTAGTTGGTGAALQVAL